MPMGSDQYVIVTISLLCRQECEFIGLSGEMITDIFDLHGCQIKLENFLLENCGRFRDGLTLWYEAPEYTNSEGNVDFSCDRCVLPSIGSDN